MNKRFEVATSALLGSGADTVYGVRSAPELAIRLAKCLASTAENAHCMDVYSGTPRLLEPDADIALQPNPGTGDHASESPAEVLAYASSSRFQSLLVDFARKIACTGSLCARGIERPPHSLGDAEAGLLRTAALRLWQKQKKDGERKTKWVDSAALLHACGLNRLGNETMDFDRSPNTKTAAEYAWTPHDEFGSTREAPDGTASVSSNHAVLSLPMPLLPSACHRADAQHLIVFDDAAAFAHLTTKPTLPLPGEADIGLRGSAPLTLLAGDLSFSAPAYLSFTETSTLFLDAKDADLDAFSSGSVATPSSPRVAETMPTGKAGQDPNIMYDFLIPDGTPRPSLGDVIPFDSLAFYETVPPVGIELPPRIGTIEAGEALAIELPREPASSNDDLWSQIMYPLLQLDSRAANKLGAVLADFGTPQSDRVPDNINHFDTSPLVHARHSSAAVFRRLRVSYCPFTGVLVAPLLFHPHDAFMPLVATTVSGADDDSSNLLIFLPDPGKLPDSSDIVTKQNIKGKTILATDLPVPLFAKEKNQIFGRCVSPNAQNICFGERTTSKNPAFAITNRTSNKVCDWIMTQTNGIPLMDLEDGKPFATGYEEDPAISAAMNVLATPEGDAPASPKKCGNADVPPSKMDLTVEEEGVDFLPSLTDRHQWKAQATLSPVAASTASQVMRESDMSMIITTSPDRLIRLNTAHNTRKDDKLQGFVPENPTTKIDIYTEDGESVNNVLGRHQTPGLLPPPRKAAGTNTDEEQELSTTLLISNEQVPDSISATVQQYSVDMYMRARESLLSNIAGLVLPPFQKPESNNDLPGKELDPSLIRNLVTKLTEKVKRTKIKLATATTVEDAPAVHPTSKTSLGKRKRPIPTKETPTDAKCELSRAGNTIVNELKEKLEQQTLALQNAIVLHTLAWVSRKNGGADQTEYLERVLQNKAYIKKLGSETKHLIRLQQLLLQANSVDSAKPSICPSSSPNATVTGKVVDGIETSMLTSRTTETEIPMESKEPLPCSKADDVIAWKRIESLLPSNKPVTLTTLLFTAQMLLLSGDMHEQNGLSSSATMNSERLRVHCRWSGYPIVISEATLQNLPLVGALTSAATESEQMAASALVRLRLIERDSLPDGINILIAPHRAVIVIDLDPQTEQTSETLETRLQGIARQLSKHTIYQDSLDVIFICPSPACAGNLSGKSHRTKKQKQEEAPSCTSDLSAGLRADSLQIDDHVSVALATFVSAVSLFPSKVAIHYAPHEVGAAKIISRLCGSLVCDLICTQGDTPHEFHAVLDPNAAVTATARLVIELDRLPASRSGGYFEGETKAEDFLSAIPDMDPYAALGLLHAYPRLIDFVNATSEERFCKLRWAFTERRLGDLEGLFQHVRIPEVNLGEQPGLTRDAKGFEAPKISEAPANISEAAHVPPPNNDSDIDHVAQRQVFKLRGKTECASTGSTISGSLFNSVSVSRISTGDETSSMREQGTETDVQKRVRFNFALDEAQDEACDSNMPADSDFPLHSTHGLNQFAITAPDLRGYYDKKQTHDGYQSDSNPYLFNHQVDPPSADELVPTDELWNPATRTLHKVYGNEDEQGASYQFEESSYHLSNHQLSHLAHGLDASMARQASLNWGQRPEPSSTPTDETHYSLGNPRLHFQIDNNENSSSGSPRITPVKRRREDNGVRNSFPGWQPACQGYVTYHDHQEYKREDLTMLAHDRAAATDVIELPANMYGQSNSEAGREPFIVSHRRPGDYDSGGLQNRNNLGMAPLGQTPSPFVAHQIGGSASRVSPGLWNQPDVGYNDHQRPNAFETVYPSIYPPTPSKSFFFRGDAGLSGTQAHKPIPSRAGGVASLYTNTGVALGMNSRNKEQFIGSYGQHFDAISTEKQAVVSSRSALTGRATHQHAGSSLTAGTNRRSAASRFQDYKQTLGVVELNRMPLLQARASDFLGGPMVRSVTLYHSNTGNSRGSFPRQPFRR